MGDKLRSVTQEKLDDYNRQRSTRPRAERQRRRQQQPAQAIKAKDGLDFERGYKARGTLGTLRSLADFMSSIRGRRKAVLFFSEGIDYPIYDVFEARDASTVVMETRDAITAAARANVNFFTIDPRGLHNMGDEIMELDAGPEDQNLRLNAQGLQDERRLAADSLRTLAEETGGIAVVEKNDFGTAFDRIVKREQQLLRARLLPAEQQARRPLPSHPGEGEAAGPEGGRAQGLRGAEGRAEEGARGRSDRRHVGGAARRC